MNDFLQRVLLFAPKGRDADVMRKLLQERAIPSLVCETPEDLLLGLQQGAAAAIATEEAFDAVRTAAIDEWLRQQPTWSDFPFVLLGARHAQPSRTQVLRTLGNVVLLERPVAAETLVRATQASMRARNRQYQTRDHLQELAQARRTVEQLNQALESRIEERTRALAAANDRLTAEIAERERVQSALVQVQKLEAVGRLTGGIAHDFNNLLQAVSMNLELLVRRSEDPRVAALGERAKKAIGRGSKLTAQLLSFARVQSLVARVADVRTLISGMQDLIDVSVGSSIRVTYDLCDESAWARLDTAQFEMAVLNLAVNAKDAMPRGGDMIVSVRLETEPRDDGVDGPSSVVVTVADRGQGIAPQLLQKVFEPFFTTKPLGSGTGLGLSQVYGFVRQSGGVTNIASAEGDGTRVEMRFPLVEPERVEAESPPGPADTAAETYRILVIEDDAEVRRVIVDSLEFAGHRVSCASDGVEGLEMLEPIDPDLVIVDYAMPRMNGAQVIEETRRLKPDLPVILATGYADMAEVERVLGTQSILTKPFDLSVLQQAVSSAMASRSPATR